MSKETITNCDGCGSRLGSQENPISLPTGPQAEAHKRPRHCRRHLRQHDICRDCLKLFVKYLAGIMLTGKAVEIDFTLVAVACSMDACRDSGLIASLICKASTYNYKATHRMLSYVIRFGNVDDRIDKEEAA